MADGSSPVGAAQVQIDPQPTRYLWQSLDYPRMAHVVTQVHQAVLALGKEN